jgi:hypothetical protein
LTDKNLLLSLRNRHVKTTNASGKLGSQSSGTGCPQKKKSRVERVQREQAALPGSGRFKMAVPFEKASLVLEL